MRIARHGLHFVLKHEGRRIRLCKIQDALYRQTSRGRRKRTDAELAAHLQVLGAEAIKKAEAAVMAHQVLTDWVAAMVRSRSPRTVVSYQSTVTYYIRSVPDHPLDKFQAQHQTRFLEGLPDALSPHSVNLHLRQLQIAWRWAEDQGLIARAPRVQKLRLTTPEVKALTERDLDEIEQELRWKLVEGPRKDRLHFYLCHYRAHMMLRYTGLRAGEMITLKLNAIDVERQLIRILPDGEWQPKSRRLDVIPMADKLRSFLRQDLSSREPGEVYYLDSGDGEPMYHTRDNFTQAFTRILKRIGITGKKPIHGYRSSLATRLIQSGVDLVTVQKILRHSQLETTRRYIDSDHLDLRQAIDSL